MSDLVADDELDGLPAAVAAAAERAGWAVALVPGIPDDDRHLVLTPSQIEMDVDHPIVVAIRAGSRSVVCHSIVPTRFDPSSMSAIMDFTTRANSGLVEGNFELDLDDGEVRFKTSFHAVEPENGAHVAAALDHALEFNLTVFGMYRSGLERCADGSATPAEAIASIELAQP